MKALLYCCSAIFFTYPIVTFSRLYSQKHFVQITKVRSVPSCTSKTRRTKENSKVQITSVEKKRQDGQRNDDSKASKAALSFFSQAKHHYTAYSKKVRRWRRVMESGKRASKNTLPAFPFPRVGTNSCAGRPFPPGSDPDRPICWTAAREPAGRSVPTDLTENATASEAIKRSRKKKCGKRTEPMKQVNVSFVSVLHSFSLVQKKKRRKAPHQE